MNSKNLVKSEFRLGGLAAVWGGPSPFELIEQAELPATVKQVIQSVVKRSRLWRREKMEVANELLAHFEDGLRGGKAAEKLIRDFGDPVLAAQLIRTSKIRNRSMNTKLLYGGFWGLLLFVLSYFGMAAYFKAGQANPSHDYIADFNEVALNVAPEQAAWPIYRPVFTKFSFSEGGDGKFAEIFVKSESAFQTLARPQDGEVWKKAINKLDESAELLDAFRAARRKSHLGLPLYADSSRYSEEDFAALFPKQKRDQNVKLEFSSAVPQEILDQSMIAILLPHYQVFRTASRLLVVDTRWAIEQNDFERVTQNVEAIMGFSRQLGNEVVLVGDLVGFSIQSMGFELIEELLPIRLDQFSDEQLARIQTAITDSNPAKMIDLNGEKYMAMDIFQRCFTDDGNGDGRITANGYHLIRKFDTILANQNQPQDSDLTGLSKGIVDGWEIFSAPFAVMQFPGRKQVEAEYLSLLEENERELKKPYYAATSLKSKDPEESDSNPFLKALFPAMQQVATGMFRAKGQQEATAAAIAIYRFQKKTEKLPKTLNDLSGTYLKELPVDQFDGQPLRYQRKDDGFLLYSIGYDRVDNAGKRKLVSTDSVNEELSKNLPEPTGQYVMFGREKGYDWVLWPRLSSDSR
jgi:hypothetical protein